MDEEDIIDKIFHLGDKVYDTVKNVGTTIVNTAKDVGGAALDYAKNNPTLAGAGAGAVYNGLTGKDVLEGAATGAAAGYGAGQLYNYYNGGIDQQRAGLATQGAQGGGQAQPIVPSAVGSGQGAGLPTTGIADGVNPVSVSTTAGAGATVAPAAASAGVGFGDSDKYTTTGGRVAGLPTAAETVNARGGYEGGTSGPTLIDRATGAYKDVQGWAKANPELATLSGKAVAGLLTKDKQAAANGVVSQGIADNADVNARNIGVVDTNNAQANANNTAANNYRDTVLSNGPQAMAIRSMAGAKSAASRGAERVMADTNMSPEMRAKALRDTQLAGALGGVTAFNSGYDSGATNQRAGLATANSMQTKLSPYSATYNSQLASDASKQANNETTDYAGLLETVMGNPGAKARDKIVNATSPTAKP